MITALIDQKYIGFVSSRLPGFSKKQSAFNFRCVLCGDSQKSKIKKRGYILERNGRYRYYCQNCGASKPFNVFLKEFDKPLYDQYLREILKEKYGEKSKEKIVYVPPKPVYVEADKLKSLKKISSLHDDHPAKEYCVSRHLTGIYQEDLYYAPQFKKWSEEISPEKLSHLKTDEPRLVLPLLTRDGKLSGYVGRSFAEDSKMRYIMITLNENDSKIFGLNKIDETKQVYAVEGAIDSLFIPNCVASCGGDIVSSLQKNSLDKSTIIIYDNECRNPDTVRKIKKAIDASFPVCIWPKSIPYKDINDMIRKGNMSPEAILEIINSNTFSGLEAKLRLSEWRKS